MEPEQPSSPASSHRADTSGDHAGLLPDAPTPGVLGGIVLVGVMVTLFSTICAAAFFTWRHAMFPSQADVAGSVVFGAFSALGLLVFVRNWWLKLVQFNRDPARWTFLVVPGFVVLGTFLGWRFDQAVNRGRSPFDRASLVCRPDGKTDQRVEQCRAAASKCIGQLMNSGASLEELKDCTRKENLGEL